MIEAGIVEDVDAIFGFHVAVDIPVGTVASRPGPIMAGSGFFEAVISGKGGHAAIPQHTIDPILAASNIIVSLQHLVSREADPLDSQVFFPHIPYKLLKRILLHVYYLVQHSIAGISPFGLFGPCGCTTHTGLVQNQSHHEAKQFLWSY